MYTLHQFKGLANDAQLHQLNTDGVALDLAYTTQQTEAILFAYHDFYVEVIIALHSEDVLAIRCFKSVKKLEPFLAQIDIDEVNQLLSQNS